MSKQQNQQQKPLFQAPQPRLENVLIGEIEPWQTTGRNAVMKSIKAFGVVSAIQLEETNGGTHRYRVIDGRRRLDAAKVEGHDSIPAIVLPNGGGLSYDAMAAGSNLARAYAPLDEAKHLEVLINQGGFTPEEISKELGLPLSTLKQRIKLISLPPEVRQAVNDKRVSPSVAAAVANLTPAQTQQAISTLQQKNTLTRDDITSIRLADKQQALEAVNVLFEPPAPPTPQHVFQTAVRQAINEGLSANDLHDAISAIAQEFQRV